MNDITVYSLEGCKKCKSLLSEFKKRSIRHYNYVCESNSQECDTIEDALSCNKYPIVKIEYEFQTTYLCLGEFSEKASLDEETKVEYYTDLDQIISRSEEIYKRL
jgi:hypothetical protein